MVSTRIVNPDNFRSFLTANALDNKSQELLYVLCLLRTMPFYLLIAGICFSLSTEYFGHTNKKRISDSYVSSQKEQSKFSCAVFAEHSLCTFKKDTPSLSLTWFLFRMTFLTVNKYCNNPCVCLNEGEKRYNDPWN